MIYYPGMAEWFAKQYDNLHASHRKSLLQIRIGAKKVVIFDHIVRKEPYYARDKYSMGIRGPAMRPQ
jgi:hypothetical protein